MQFFELLLLISSLTILISKSFLLEKTKLPVLLGGLILILSAHLIFEGYRWQMLPAYLIWSLAIINTIITPKRTSPLWLRTLKLFGILLIALPAVLLPTALPEFSLPEPTGDFKVGTRDLLLELERDEPITDNHKDQRKLMIKVWYPSNEVSEVMDPYIDAGGRHGFALKYGLPKSSFNYLDLIDTNVYKDTPLANGPFPVLIFSHGYNSKANGYNAMLSNLASHGYIIFAINHTYESTGTTFLDGSEVYFNYDYAQSIEANTWSMMQPTLQAFHDQVPFAERHPIVKKALNQYFVKDVVERWSTDIIDVVNHLEEWNRNSFFQDKMNTKAIGVFGHSRGGGAAGDAHLKDDRIKAGANVDGVQWGNIVNTSFHQPFLYITADWPESHEDLNLHAYINKSQDVFYEAKILGTAHSNFMDIPFMVPYQSLSEAGSINPELGIEITNSLLMSYFNAHLKKKPNTILELPNTYNQLHLLVHKPNSAP